MDAQNDAVVNPEAPEAWIAPAGRPSWVWVPPLIALVLITVAAISSWRERGFPIEVHFQHGHGLKPGDTLRYRGINVGEVERVGLDEELSGITVSVRLDAAAEEIARSGSRFWVVRPQIGLTGIVGIDTVVGARYLAVQPGEATAPSRRSFVGLDEPPVLENIEPGTLEVVLEARRRGSLQPGAPLTYRGIRIGRALSVALANDSTSIEVRAYILPAFATLVRDNTRFWDLGGLDVDLGLSGVKLRVDSLESLVVGGIGMATPTRAGEPVASGHRFELAETPDEDWLGWRPPLPLGSSRTAAGFPDPAPVAMRWRQGLLLASDRERRGWALPVEAGWLLPLDLAVEPEDARENTTSLRLGERPVALPAEVQVLAGGMALLPSDEPSPRTAWTADRMRRMEVPEDCLIIVGDADPLAVGASRLAPGPDGWLVDLERSLNSSLHGACVIAREDGALVGSLLVEDDRARVVPVSVPD